MYLTYGSYTFESNSLWIAQRIEAIWNEGGRILAHKHVWDVQGYLSGSSQSDLTTKQDALVAALKRRDQDLIFYQDDGSESATTMKQRGSITGVKITRGPDFTDRQGSEYATERAFTFSAEAEYPTSEQNNLLVMWEEVVTTSGGGPLYIHRPALDGPAQKQKLYSHMPYVATQSGYAIGYRSYPFPPAPFFPGAMKHAPQFKQTSPKRRNDREYESYKTEWVYEFESISPLLHFPTLWR